MPRPYAAYVRLVLSELFGQADKVEFGSAKDQLPGVIWSMKVSWPSKENSRQSARDLGQLLSVLHRGRDGSARQYLEIGLQPLEEVDPKYFSSLFGAEGVYGFSLDESDNRLDLDVRVTAESPEIED